MHVAYGCDSKAQRLFNTVGVTSKGMDMGVNQSRDERMLWSRDPQGMLSDNSVWLAAANIGDMSVTNIDKAIGNKLMTVKDFDIFDNEGAYR
ncbi:hypothetical protein SNK03_007675 [Fusarium graminearum]|nr:unnamed protein product [Fusarium graminearum]